MKYTLEEINDGWILEVRGGLALVSLDKKVFCPTFEDAIEKVKCVEDLREIEKIQRVQEKT